MAVTPRIYPVGPEPDAAAIVGALQKRFDARRHASVDRSWIYLDTFDWRIFRSGAVLRAGQDQVGPLLELCSDGQPTIARLANADLPAFAGDLPTGPVGRAIGSAIGVRRLLPHVEVRHRGMELRLLDDQQKTLARIELLERSIPAAGRTAGTPLGTVLRLLPVRGYDDTLRDLVRFCESELALEEAPQNELATALATDDRHPGDYSAKLALEIPPRARADDGVKLVLRRLLDTIVANHPGTIDNLDSEFLHDLRVAVRRTRSALGQLGAVIDPSALERFKSEFSWLGRLTGPTRDLDVYLLEIETYERALPEATRPHLRQLERFLLDRHVGEQANLAAALRSPRYQTLVRDWGAFLDTTAAEKKPTAAGEPIVEVASDAILRAYRRVVKRGRAISSHSPGGDLHRLRIDCKKLRYLLEFFRSLYPRPQMRRLVATLKQLQDCLGDFNDFEVQQEMLRTFAHQMAHDRETAIDTLLTMGRLAQHLDRAALRERRRFAKRFRPLSSARTERRLCRLLSGEAPSP